MSPNKNYLAGRRLEYEVKADYESQGYLIIRSAGSKTPVDLVALNNSGQCILIQCKRLQSERGLKSLILKFQTTKPYNAATYTQVLAIKIKGQSGYTKVYAT